MESFTPATAEAPRATVQAREVTPEPDCQFSFDYGWPCESAPGYTCLNSCPATCPATCAHTCGNTCGALCTVGAICQPPE